MSTGFIWGARRHTIRKSHTSFTYQCYQALAMLFFSRPEFKLDDATTQHDRRFKNNVNYYSYHCNKGSYKYSSS